MRSAAPASPQPCPPLVQPWAGAGGWIHTGRSVLCRQDLEERCFLNLYQNWEARVEEHLTLKQEEGEAGPGSPHRGIRTLRPLGFTDLGGGGLQTRPPRCAHPALCGGPSGVPG